jgi:hypothetical protein
MDEKNSYGKYYDEMFNDADFTKRELQEIEFARIYASSFDHGTDGHHRLKIIAKLADMLVQNRIRTRIEVLKESE